MEDPSAYQNPQTNDHTKCDTTPDTKTTLPDLHDVTWAVTEARPVSHHVIEARPDNSRRNCPKRHFRDVVALSDTALLETSPREPNRSNHTERDH